MFDPFCKSKLHVSFRPKYNDNVILYWVFGIIGFIVVCIFLMFFFSGYESNFTKKHRKIKEECQLIYHEEGKWIYSSGDSIFIPDKHCYICNNGVEECF